MSKILALFFSLIIGYVLHGQSLGVYQNSPVPKVGGNVIIDPIVPPSRITKSSVKVGGHFRGEVYIEPTTGKIHVNNAYPNGDYKVDVFAPNGLTTSFILTVAPTDCKLKGRFLLSNELSNIPSKSSRVADINKDGKSDLILLRQDIGGLTVMLNTINGFEKNADLILGYVPESFDIGDLNNDGLVDIAVTNGPAQTIMIFYGAQNSSFQAPVSIQPIALISLPQSPLIQGPYSVENPKKLIIQDLNNDGFTDILIFSSLQGIVYIGLGKEDNTFDFNQSVRIQDTNEFGDIEIADLTNDGFYEIILNIGRPGTVALIGMLSNKFQLVSSGVGSIGGSAGIPDYEIFDINHDGNLDIYYTDGVNGAELWLGRGGGLFLPPEQFSFGINNVGLYLKILDLNGDQFLDYFQYNTPNSQLFGSVIGNGFITESEYFDPIPGNEFSDLSILDINGDNLLDVCVSDISGTTSILLGSKEYFIEKKNISYVTNVGEIAGIENDDLNSDGINDFIVGDRMNNSIHVFKGNGSAGYDYFSQFSLINVPISEQLTTINKADLNNDQIIDIIAAVGDRIYFFKGLGQGAFQQFNSINQNNFLKFNQKIKKLHSFDYNKDGLNDLITITSDSIYLNLNSGDFIFNKIISSSLNTILDLANGFEIKDINSDSFADVVISDGTSETIFIFTGDKNGKFILNKKMISPGIQGFTLDDYNQDGIVDIVIAEQQVGIVLYLGDVQFNFSRNKVLYFTESLVYRYLFSGKDLNGDNLNDFLFFDFSGSVKILFYNLRGTQVSEQIKTSKAPLFQQLERIYTSDIVSPLNSYFDGNIDLYFIDILDGSWSFLINESLEKNISYNGNLASKIKLCQPENIVLETNYQLNNTLQWEYSTDNITYYSIAGQDASRVIYTPVVANSYVRVRSSNDPLCPSGNNSYTKPVEIKISSLYSISILDDIYATCDSVLTINIPEIFNKYLWSTGDSTNTIQLKNSGNISISISDSLHCSINDTAVIEMSKLNIIQQDTAFCHQNQISLHIDSLALKNNLYLNQIRNGLIFYAPMDSNSYDHMANFIHKTESGISYSSDRFGTPNKAVSFNGQSNNNVVYDYQNIIKQKAYTVAAWVKVTNGMFWIKAPRIGFLGTKDFIETFAENGIDAPGLITPNTWHHIATVWDSATSLHLLYIDGRQVRLGTGTSPEFLSTPDIAPIIIGSQSLPGDFIGSIDDVAIWSRILTPAEILQLYQDDLKVVWSDGSIGNSITVIPTVSTQYFASYTNGSSVCIDSVRVVISKIDTTVEISSSLPKCFSDSIILRVQEGKIYQWYKNDALINSASSNIFKAIDTGIYSVIISDSIGCFDSTAKITVSDVIVSSRFSINDTTQLLSGNNFVFKNLSSFSGIKGLSYEWEFGDGTSSTEESPMHKYNQVGTFKVTMRAASSSGCIDSTSLDITVSPDLTALFNVNDSIQCLVGNLFLFRDSSVVIGDSISYLWEFGDGGTSSVQHPSYSYSRSGIYNVKLVVIGSIGNTDSVYLRIRVDSMPQANFLVNDSLQCLSGNKYVFLNNTVVPIGDSYSFKWDFGDGDTSVLPSPVHTYKVAAKCNVSLIVQANNGCSDTIFKMIHVFSQPKASFSVNDTTQPFGTNQFVFKNLSTVTDETPLRYEWDFGDGALSKEQSPIHTYDSVGVYRVRLFTFTEQDCVDSTFLKVSIFSELKAGFIVNDSIQCLVGNLFEFTDTSKVDGGSLRFKWDFGDGIYSANQHAVHRYESPGLYIVKVLVTGSFGGIDSAFMRIKVNSMPDIGFRVNDTLQCLNGNSYLFLNTSVVASRDSVNYSWDFGDGITTNIFSPLHVYSKSGIYDVKLFGTNIYGCSDTSVVNIEILSSPNTSFSINDSVQCLAGNRFIFTNTTPKNGNNLNYLWEFGDTKMSSEESPSHSFDKPGFYVVKLISGNTAGCYDTVSQAINVFSTPISKFVVNDSLQCINNNLFRFIDSTKVPNGERYSLMWNFGDGTSSNNLSPTHTYRQTGSFVVKMVSFVSEGCTDTFSVKVTVAPLPSFLKYDPVDVVSGIGMQLKARKIGEKYLWMPSTGLSSPLIPDPTVNLRNEQRYVIKITTSTRCDVYDTLLVRVFNQYDIFVPRGFTPNYDGKNDRLFPFLVGVKSLKYFKIYDRWGNLIYNKSNVDRSNGWDGTVNGKLAPVGTYVWVCEGFDLDNNLIKRRGNFVLIR